MESSRVTILPRASWIGSTAAALRRSDAATRDSSRTIASRQVAAVDGEASAAASDISAAAEEVSAELVLRITSLNHLPSGWREILAPSFAASRASGVTLLMLHGEFGLFIVDHAVRQQNPI